MDSLQLPVDADGWITLLTAKHLMDGVLWQGQSSFSMDYRRRLHQFNGSGGREARMVIKRRPYLVQIQKLRTGNGMEGFQRR